MNNYQKLEMLDGLIAGVESSTGSSGRPGLLFEHLRASRRYMMGGMPDECRLTLRQAKESAAYCVADASARAKTVSALQGLIDATARTA